MVLNNFAISAEGNSVYRSANMRATLTIGHCTLAKHCVFDDHTSFGAVAVIPSDAHVTRMLFGRRMHCAFSCSL